MTCDSALTYTRHHNLAMRRGVLLLFETVESSHHVVTGWHISNVPQVGEVLHVVDSKFLAAVDTCLLHDSKHWRVQTYQARPE